MPLRWRHDLCEAGSEQVALFVRFVAYLAAEEEAARSRHTAGA